MNTEILNIESVYESAKSKGYKSPYYIPVNSDVQLYLIQKWLRDIYKISIEICIDWDLEKSFLSNLNILDHTEGGGLTYHNSYEDALLHGISEALQLIEFGIVKIWVF